MQRHGMDVACIVTISYYYTEPITLFQVGEATDRVTGFFEVSVNNTLIHSKKVSIAMVIAELHGVYSWALVCITKQ